jgi:hypothetical protein
MSTGEIIGLALATALISGAVGVGIGMALTVERRSARFERNRAWARWRAARLAASRSCFALAVAMRAAREFPTARQAILRKSEIRRARDQWNRALYILDAADGLLLALEEKEPAELEADSFAHRTQEALAAAIDGDQPELRSLRRLLHQLDRETKQRFEQAVAPRSRPKPPAVVLDLLATFRSIYDRWTRP